LVAAGVKRQKQRRRPKLHSPRARKPQAGMLWQIDASKHDWLEGRSPAFALLAAIDDATGLVVGAVFRSEETTEGYFEVMRQGIRTYGIPAALYSDRHSIFKSRNEKATIEQELAGEEAPLSNFGQAMRDLGISHPKARSPQAKGRIERLWGTLQDRLLVELRILGVTSLEEANRVLPQLIAKHNKRFAVKPEQTESMYRKLDTNLDLVFCMREMRSVGPGQTISYGGKIYTLQTSSTRQTIPPKTRIEVRLNMKGKLFAWYQGQALGLKEAEKPKQAKPTPEKKKADLAPPHKPAANHPWRVWRGPKELNRALQKQD
ncbi:ISNCY family transposase, partial [Effusibacillus lacus]|uniref:ISNCY family transposase n=1 Tax=Effusibacillus lacus TaxID=1348429 RepID=UPI000BB94FC5